MVKSSVFLGLLLFQLNAVICITQALVVSAKQMLINPYKVTPLICEALNCTWNRVDFLYQFFRQSLLFILGQKG